MSRLCSSLLLSIVATRVLVLATPVRAESILFSNPSYSVYNFISYHKPGDPYATVAVQDSQSNTTGNLSLSSNTGYATAFAESDTFRVRTTSSADGSQLAQNGFDSISTEGLGWFDTDFLISSDRPQVTVDLSFVIYNDFVSTDPDTPGPPFSGTFAAMGLINFLVYDAQHNRVDASGYGSNFASYYLDSGVPYQLHMVINAVASVRDSTGYASAATGFDAGLAIQPVPEPSTGLLVIAGLLGLAVRRRGCA